MATATYSFKATDVTGLPQKGELVAASKQAVTEQLLARGLTVTNIEEKKTGLNMEIGLPKRVKPGDLTVMTRQLATMVSSGMTLLRAFYVLEEQVEHPKLKDVLAQVREDIEGGQLLSGALGRHPKVFSPLYVAMVRAGEAGGVLEQSLERVAAQLEADDSLRRQVKAAMMYPSVVLSFSLIVLFALIAFIVPVFVGVFKDFGGQLPAITQFTVSLSHLVTHQWYLLFGGIAGGIYAFRRWKSSSWGRPQWDAFRLKIPMKI